MIRTEHVVTQFTRRLAVLGAAGVGLGATLALSARTPGQRAFGQQTAAWGAIDLAIAGLSASRETALPNAHRLRKVLLLNAALDVGYVAAGAHLAVRRPSLRGRLAPDQAIGHGTAVVVQGALLFAMDLLHARALAGPETIDTW